ncbi:response regulator [Candidatus Villigracilis affinis]|uniref:response regulator n=1 Tax=Candidatus Villigracilis affinis TaxID=3140682 RepID=UPI001D1D2741|nr:response regulator [Anaerolineales bacterium]
MAENRPRIKPRIHEWMTQDSCIREKFVDGLWTRLVAVRELQSATGEDWMRCYRPCWIGHLRESCEMFSSETKHEQVKYKASVLIVDDYEGWQNLLAVYLSNLNYQVEVAGSYSEASSILNEKPIDIAVIDLRLDESNPSNLDGLKVIEQIHNTGKRTSVIIFSGYITVNLMRDVSQKYQILDFIEKDSSWKKPSDFSKNDDLPLDKLINAIERGIQSMDENNRFRYLLQVAIDLYAKTQKRQFADVLDEMNDQLGYGRNSMTIQKWLRENTIPNSAELEYFAKKITSCHKLRF